MHSLIVTARCAIDAQTHLNGLRKTYYPPERNLLDAHLTILHQIPQAKGEPLTVLITQFCTTMPLRAKLVSLHAWRTGFAVVVWCPALMRLHKMLLSRFAACLSAQDRAKLWPHVTLQNKTPKCQSLCDFYRARAEFLPQETRVVAIDIWRYEGGPWKHIKAIHFQV